jgi:hypothetical protein
LILRELRNLLPSFMFILSTTLPNLSIPDVPFPNSHQKQFQVKPATLLIPIDLFSFPFGGGVLRYRYQSGSFPLINVGSGFHCLRSFLYYYHCTSGKDLKRLLL